MRILNYQNLIEIDITPKAATRTWKPLAAGISSFDYSFNESVDQQTFMNDAGFASSFVEGKQLTFSFSGIRITGDAAQDFVASKEAELGDECLTNIRITAADGSKKSGQCTLTGIVANGGDAGASSAFSFEAHVNGRPDLTPISPAPALTATIEAGTEIGTTKATATAGVGNSLVYKLEAQTAGGVRLGQVVSGYFAYTSGDDIIASVDQYLQLYELDATKRVVLFSETKLAAGDIKA